jgi:uncharacterized OB-fold protein
MTDVRSDAPEGRYSVPFWEALTQDRFLVHRCKSCASDFFPPAPVCPYCGSQFVEWHGVSGSGQLYSFTRQHTTPPRFEAPLVVGTVELEAGPRLLAPIAAEYDDLAIGTPVEVVATEYDPNYDRGALAEYPFFEAVPTGDTGTGLGISADGTVE